MKTLITALGFALALIAISGCEQAEQAANTASEKTEAALKQAAQASEKVMEKAGKKMDEAVQAGKESASAAASSLKQNTGETQTLEEDVPKGAVAILHATAGNEVKGTVHFRPDGNGLNIKTTATGLSPGLHGYHFHLYGDCTAPDGTSAGTHFNLEGSSLNPPEDIDHITGNLGDLDADQNGNAQHSGKIENVSLTGPKSIIGRSIIVHAMGNDHNHPPIGAAGARLACGVIGIANPQASP